MFLLFSFRLLARYSLALAFSVLAWAQAGSNASQTDSPRLAFEKYTLSNGMQVILHTDRKLPMVHVNCWYHVGSKNERPGRTGFAHLFEHMMFEGSKNANTKYFSLIEKAGANLFEGGVNGTTSQDRTNYFATVPSGSLEYVLWLESDRLATLTDVLTQNKLDNEREIVKNERRQSLENQPYGRAFLLISENLYPGGHPYAHSVIGSHEDLSAASLDDVKDFFRSYYTPNNLSLAITGDFDPAEAKKLVNKYFGSIPPGPALDRPKLWVPTLEGEKVVEVKDHVALERTYFAWPSPAYFESGDAALDLASLVLSSGLSSRLQKALMYDQQLCADVMAVQDTNEIASQFVLWATARPGIPLARVENAVTAETARFAKDGPTPEELNRAKNKWELQYISGLERIGGFGGQADLLNQYNVFLGNPDGFAADLERHRNLTAEDVRLAASKWLSPNNRLLVRFHPESAATPTGVTLDRTQQPALGKDSAFHAPAVQTASLDNGLTIYVVERNDLPKVSVTLATRAGSASDPRGKEGLASLTLQTMKRGTRGKKALDIDNTLGDLGTTLENYTDREYATLSIDLLGRNLRDGLMVMADVAQHPSFPAEEVERERKRRLDAIAKAENSPSQISRRLTAQLAFGTDHPYGHPSDGFRSSIQALEPEDLLAFHSANWKPGSSTLIFAGNISLDQAAAAAKSAFASWPSGSAPRVNIPNPNPPGAGKIYLVNRSEAAQTFVSQILPGPKRDSSDYYPFLLSDAVWGGSAGARLGMNLREQKGYSYGVFTSPRFYSGAGLWVASGGVQTNKTKESVIEFQKELRFIAGERPVTSAELSTAKSFKIRGYAQQFESLRRVSDQILELWSLGRPLTELQREPLEMEKADLAAVNAAAEKYATPSRATLLLVGDAAKIEGGIRELDMGEVVVVDVEGHPVRSSASR